MKGARPRSWQALTWARLLTMTNHKRSLSSGVAGPLIASLSALVLLVGISWFVLRDTGDRKPTSQANPVTLGHHGIRRRPDHAPR